jgi:hypothetical protein
MVLNPAYYVQDFLFSIILIYIDGIRCNHVWLMCDLCTAYVFQTYKKHTTQLHINPKENKKKKRQKKKKKESHYFKGARIGMQGFWKINTTSFIL